MSLRSELEGDLVALAGIHQDVRESMEAVRAQPANRREVDALAGRLHRLYGCIEDMCYRVSVHINGEVPSGPHSHKDLLDRAAMEVPGKRRALWRTASVVDLDRLRKFRHFFRTRYAVELDRAKVLTVGERALAVLPAVEADVREFAAALR